MLDFPVTSSGLFVTGSSAANLLAVLVARTGALGDCRTDGLRKGGQQLVGYTSAEAHECIRRAFEIAGIGSNFLRAIPVDDKGSMRIEALQRQIEADRRAGLRPFIVVGTAGTVNTGAIDDLDRLADTCRAAGLWLHVDGAFGALCALSPRLKPLLHGIERADSVAFDFHKWAHVPYDAGFLLVRDAEAHRDTFSSPAAYLNRASAGLAAGELWPCDLGPDLSRGFRALKTWFTLRVFGADKIAASIEHTCEIARYLAARLRDSDLFEVHAPVALNIVCFGLRMPADDVLNKAIVVDLHERGVAAPSTTVLGGRTVIRAAIVNHRTTEQDIDAFIVALRESALRAASAMMKRSDPQSESATPAAPRKARRRNARRRTTGGS
jgi:aromatic-L-amino-acid decarboxylase